MENSSDKSRSVALILSLLLGPFGAHRFYVGKAGTGALMALTLGGMGIWYLYDLVLVATGNFEYVQGRRLVSWDAQGGERSELPETILEELDALRAEVAELHERVEFTERLLARPPREGMDQT